MGPRNGIFEDMALVKPYHIRKERSELYPYTHDTLFPNGNIHGFVTTVES